MSPLAYGPSDIVNPRFTPFAGMVPESYWLTKVLIFDFEWITREVSRPHVMPDHDHALSLQSGLKDTFRMLRSFEIRLAMTSNHTQKTVVEKLHQLNLAEDFDCIRCAEELSSLKPSPDLHINAMETLGVRALKTIALETTLEGVQAAKAAGIFCVGTPEIKKETDYYLKSFTEHPLLHVLEQMDRVKRNQFQPIV